MKLFSSDDKKRNVTPSHTGGAKKQRPVNQPRAEKKEKPAATPGKARTALIIAAAAVAVIFAAAAAGTYLVSNVNTIYPNVSVDGVDIGGMNLPEAARMLDANGYETPEGQTLNVLLPLDFSLKLDAGEFSTAKQVTDIAQDAWDACHSRNPLKNTVTYLGCVFGGMKIDADSHVTVDEQAVRAEVDNIVREINLKLMGSDVIIGEESIIVIKGAKSISIDSDELTSLIITALAERSYADIEYAGEIETDEQLDVEQLHETVFCEHADASYDKKKGCVIEAVVGMDFDTDEAQRLWNAAQYGDEVEIPLTITEPEMTTEKYEELLFADCLAAKTTSLIGSSSNRVNNVTKAAKAINEFVLMPGEEFSYNDALGERTAENGYLRAGAYSGGQVTQEYGGGICQVSSTLYFCALYSNLKIVDRTCHMFAVGYLPPGLDATVSWGGPEFVFKNDRDFPIKIMSYVEDGSVSVEIWGTDVDGSYVQMTYGTWLVYDREHTEVAIGYKAQTYRNVFDKDGNLLKKTAEAQSYYRYHDEDIEWPEESPSPEISPSPEVTPTPPVTTPTPPAVTPTPETTAAPEATPTPPAAETPTPTTPVEPAA